MSRRPRPRGRKTRRKAPRGFPFGGKRQPTACFTRRRQTRPKSKLSQPTSHRRQHAQPTSHHRRQHAATQNPRLRAHTLAGYPASYVCSCVCEITATTMSGECFALLKRNNSILRFIANSLPSCLPFSEEQSVMRHLLIDIVTHLSTAVGKINQRRSVAKKKEYDSCCHSNKEEPLPRGTLPPRPTHLCTAGVRSRLYPLCCRCTVQPRIAIQPAKGIA